MCLERLQTLVFTIEDWSLGVFFLFHELMASECPVALENSYLGARKSIWGSNKFSYFCLKPYHLFSPSTTMLASFGLCLPSDGLSVFNTCCFTSHSTFMALNVAMVFQPLLLAHVSQCSCSAKAQPYRLLDACQVLCQQFMCIISLNYLSKPRWLLLFCTSFTDGKTEAQ